MVINNLAIPNIRAGYTPSAYDPAMCGRFVQLPVIDFGQPGLADLAHGLAEIQPSHNLTPTRHCSRVPS